MTTFTRGDFSGKRGVAHITDNNTWIGDGGLNNVALGATVSEQRMAIGFSKQVVDTLTGDVIGQFRAPAAGALIGMSFYARTVCSTGHGTLTAYVGATASTTFVLDYSTAGGSGDTRSESTWVAAGGGNFAAGKRISVQFSSDQLATSTLDVSLFYKI